MSHIIAANLVNFRGPEPDPGTAFECGVGYALGKSLYGYSQDPRTCTQKVEKYYGALREFSDHVFDKDGMIIENFGLRWNIMLRKSVKQVKGGFEECIAQIRRDINSGIVRIA